MAVVINSSSSGIPNDTNARTKNGAFLATDGNSITALAGGPAVTGLQPQADTGWLNWGLAFSGHSLRWVDQQAVSGRTIAQQQALLSTWVPSTLANILCFLEGTNSIAGYVTGGMTDAQAAAAAWTDMQAYLTAVRGYNKFTRIILPTITPRGSTASRNAAHEWFNQKIRALCASDGFYILVDFWKIVVDPTSATMSAKANYLAAADTLHPTPKGARAMGTEWARVINLLTLPNSSLIPVSALVRSIDTLAVPINSTPLFAGTTGTLLGTGTGTVATGWRAGVISGTADSCVASLIDDPLGFGKAQRLVVSGGSSGGIVGIAMHITEALTYQVANDYMRAIAKVAVSGAANVKAIYISTSAFTSQAYSCNGFETTAAWAAVADYDNSDITAPFYMTGPAIKFPGNSASGSPLTISIRVLFGAAAGAITLDVSQAALLNLGQSPVLTLY